jgi:quercetin dioxygenase-like cupin family protein
MNIKQLHEKTKSVSSFSILKTSVNNITSLQILEGSRLKEHVSKTLALLICIDGNVKFENEIGEINFLKNGDYVTIQPLVKHWIDGIENSQLILIN